MLTEAALVVAAGKDGGTSWTAYIGVPGGVAAIVGLLLYAIGAIRPLAVRKAQYWHQAETTRFSCTIKNRSWLMDRSLTALSLIRLPSLTRRARHPRWRRQPQYAELVPTGEAVSGLTSQPSKLSKRDAVNITGELLKDGRSGKFDLDPPLRLQAHAGDKRSRSRRVRKQQPPEIITGLQVTGSKRQ